LVVGSASTWGRVRAPFITAALAIALGGLLWALVPGAAAECWALSLGGFASAFAGRFVARRLPAGVDNALERHRTLSVVWALVAAATVIQFGRLSSYMGDGSVDWFLTTRNPFWAKHECLPAYFQAAGLASGGETNIYHAHHYPGLDASAAQVPVLSGMTIEDPFQYAPQFLLWPALGMAITTDYGLLRLGWFGLNTTLLLFTAFRLAAFIGGRSGRAAALLSPLVLLAFPVLHTLQYGQFHLAAIALGLLAMCCVATPDQMQNLQVQIPEKDSLERRIHPPEARKLDFPDRQADQYDCERGGFDPTRQASQAPDCNDREQTCYSRPEANGELQASPQ
jgi:hypothetical protein